MWTIPAQRIKAGKEHRVPLSERCMEILEEAEEAAYFRSDLLELRRELMETWSTFVTAGSTPPMRSLSSRVFALTRARAPLFYSAGDTGRPLAARHFDRWALRSAPATGPGIARLA